MIRNVMPWVLTCCLIAQPLSGSLSHAGEAPVAVLNFRNTTGDSQWGGLEKSIPDELAVDLTKRGLAVRRLQFEDPEQVRGMGVQMMVWGNYTVIDDQLKLNVRVVDVQSGDVLYGEQVEGKAKEQRKVVGRVGALLWSYWTGEPIDTGPPAETKDRPWYAPWWVKASGGAVGSLVLYWVIPKPTPPEKDKILPKFPKPPAR